MFRGFIFLSIPIIRACQDDEHHHNHLNFLREGSDGSIGNRQLGIVDPQVPRCGVNDASKEEIDLTSKLVTTWVMHKKRERELRVQNEKTRPFHSQALRGALYHRNRNRGLLEENITVPTYFHVITDAELEAIPQDMIDAQMITLNNEFETSGFQFVLMETPAITVNASWYNQTLGPEEDEMKAALRKGGTDALNVYLVDLPGRILGVATLPWTVGLYLSRDGVMLYNETMPAGGLAYQFNEGKTLVHEVGHWLGLYHTFQVNGTCDEPGDGVADTPAQYMADYVCTEGHDSCPLHEGFDPIHNFMNYAVDSCLSEFTPLQNERMQAIWNIYRATGAAIPSNNNCLDAIPIVLDGNNEAVIIGTTVGSIFSEPEPANCLGLYSNSGVWYSIEVPSKYNLTIASCGQNEYHDLTMSIYYGHEGCNDAMICRAGGVATDGCLDNPLGYSLEIEFQNIQTFAMKYYIFVNGFGKADFVFNATVTEPVLPDNDLCEDAEVIDMNGACSWTVDGTTVGASDKTDASAPICNGFSAKSGVWYALQVPGKTYVNVSTCNQTTYYYNVISVYTGTCGTLTCVAAEIGTEACLKYSAEVSFQNKKNTVTTYYILVHAYHDGNTGDFSLTISFDDSSAGSGTCQTLSPTNSTTTAQPTTMSPTDQRIISTPSPTTLVTSIFTQTTIKGTTEPTKSTATVLPTESTTTLLPTENTATPTNEGTLSTPSPTTLVISTFTATTTKETTEPANSMSTLLPTESATTLLPTENSITTTNEGTVTTTNEGTILTPSPTTLVISTFTPTETKETTKATKSATSLLPTESATTLLPTESTMTPTNERKISTHSPTTSTFTPPLTKKTTEPTKSTATLLPTESATTLLPTENTATPTNEGTILLSIRTTSVASTSTPTATKETKEPTESATTLLPTESPTDMLTESFRATTSPPTISFDCDSEGLVCSGFMGMKGTYVYRNRFGQCIQRCSRMRNFMLIRGFECGICSS